MSDPYKRNLSDRYRLKQLAFLGALLAGTLFMLSEAVQLEFSIRGTIGPGLYPTIVLGALVLTCVFSILSVVLRRDILVLSPFVEGLRNDSVLRGVVRRIHTEDGKGARVIVRNGVGVFSALVAGLRGNATLTVVSSETPDMTRKEIAALTLQRFQPVCRLFYEPDALVVSTDGAADLHQFFTAAQDKRSIKVAFARLRTGARASETWIEQHAQAKVEGTYEQTAKSLLDQLNAGSCDAVVMPLHEAADAKAAGQVAILAAFADDPTDCFGLCSTSQDLGYPLTSGDWSGLALAKGASEADGERFHEILSRAFHEYTHSDERHDEDATWAISTPEQFRGFLQDVAMGPQTDAVEPPSGKILGFAVALLLVALFPVLMDLIGFIPAAFLFLATTTILLTPRLGLWAAVRILVLSAVISAGLYYLFWEVFYVVFPEGVLFGDF